MFNVRSANTASHNRAVSRTEKIAFKWIFENNKLVVPNYHSYPESDKLRGQEIDLILEIPIGDSILFDDEYY